MIQQLSDLGKRLRNTESHDALKSEFCTIDLVIDCDGNFVDFQLHDKIITVTEALASKKGKARLLVDKAEEVLSYNNATDKHALFINKLNEYENLAVLKPVFSFYGNNKISGIEKAIIEFDKKIQEKERGGNICFRIDANNYRLHESAEIKKAIVEKYENNMNKELQNKRIKCSICGNDSFPVNDRPHGMIKRVPAGQTSGCALVSFNEKAYESYGLEGNENSKICTNCAKTYVEGLNWLMESGKTVNNGKKDVFHYSNRKKLGEDTAIVFWTKKESEFDLFDLLDQENEISMLSTLEKEDQNTNVTNADFLALLNAPERGRTEMVESVDENYFYAMILSGAAARIAVRQWFETSITSVKENLRGWFKDIAVTTIENKEKKKFFPSVSRLAQSCGTHRKDPNGNFKCEYDDPVIGRVAEQLYISIFRNIPVSLTVLNHLLRRVKTEEGRVTKERVALIKLILNRNKKGGIEMKEELDPTNGSTPYVCGRIFAQMESIQRGALGKNVNAGIRERFFSSACTTPSIAFGRLMKMTQNHLSKIRGEKPGLAINLDKKLQELFSKIDSFPLTFSLEDQGQFAIGYYHQKQEIFSAFAELND